MFKLKFISLNLFAISAVLVVVFFFLGAYNMIIFFDWKVCSIMSSSLQLGVVLDMKSLLFSSVVLLISSSILFYSMSYMYTEEFIWRFISILLLFVFSMIVLTFSSNLMGLLLGWDGLGISSFFLVIYYQNKISLNAGMITAMTNRLGDFGIIVLLSMWVVYGSWDFIIISQAGFNFSCLFIMIVLSTISTKSAQIPFSAWLPAAMAAPTPVSSLVHSSTLVTAGIFLLLRLSNMNLLFQINTWVVFLGATTSLMSCIATILEKDFKKIIALSTLSHLGLMVSFIGTVNIDSAFFHLIMHAFFKALLFMTVGVVIHQFSGYQAFDMISSGANLGKFNSSVMLISLASLSGLPFLSGFFSKDLGLNSSLGMNISLFMVVVIFFTSLASVVYSVRIIKKILFEGKKSPLLVWVQGSNLTYGGSMMLLLFMAIFVGELFQVKIFLGMNFLFFSFLMKMVIPAMLVGLSAVAWVMFCVRSFKLGGLGSLIVTMFFLTPVSNFYPSFCSKSVSKMMVTEQSGVMSIYTTKIYVFWEGMFFFENLYSQSFYKFFVHSFMVLVVTMIILMPSIN